MSALCWNRSHISRVTAPVWHKCKKMVTCSSFVIYLESIRPAYIWSSCTSFWKTCFDIPRLSWNQPGWPCKSSCTQSSPESLELYMGVLIRCGVMYCITTDPPTTADRKAIFLWLRCCFSCKDFCSAWFCSQNYKPWLLKGLWQDVTNRSNVCHKLLLFWEFINRCRVTWNHGCWAGPKPFNLGLYFQQLTKDQFACNLRVRAIALHGIYESTLF